MRTRAQHPSGPGPSLEIVRAYARFLCLPIPSFSVIRVRIDSIVGTVSLRVTSFYFRFFFARASIIINLRVRVFPPTHFSASRRRVTIFIATDRRLVAEIRPSINKTYRYRATRIEPSKPPPIATPLYEHKRFHGASVEAFEAVPLHTT